MSTAEPTLDDYRAVVPAGTVGKALLDSIAITVDDRTNTVVVAGKEDSVALVEVLVKRLDGEVAAGWVEPRVLPLRYADAEELAATLQAMLVAVPVRMAWQSWFAAAPVQVTPVASSEPRSVICEYVVAALMDARNDVHAVHCVVGVAPWVNDCV